MSRRRRTIDGVRHAGAAEMSGESAVTRDGFADDEILHLIRFIRVERLGIVEEAREVERRLSVRWQRSHSCSSHS
jgi:hypothetical protein